MLEIGRGSLILQSVATSRAYVLRLGDDDDDGDDGDDFDDDGDGDDDYSDGDVGCERFSNKQKQASFNLSVYVYPLILIQFIYGSTCGVNLQNNK